MKGVYEFWLKFSGVWKALCENAKYTFGSLKAGLAEVYTKKLKIILKQAEIVEILKF